MFFVDGGVSWITATIAFPAAVIVGKIVAGGIDLLFGTQDNPWVRLWVALAIVFAMTAAALANEQPANMFGWIGVIVMAVLNGLLLFSTMMGVPEGMKALRKRSRGGEVVTA